jgi:hypothetical protein
MKYPPKLAVRQIFTYWTKKAIDETFAPQVGYGLVHPSILRCGEGTIAEGYPPIADNSNSWQKSIEQIQ